MPPTPTEAVLIYSTEMELKRGFLTKHYATSRFLKKDYATTRSMPAYTVASHPNHLEPNVYSDRDGGGGALEGQGAPTQKFLGPANSSEIAQTDIDWLRSMAKTPEEERAFLHDQILVNFDLCQEGVDRLPMWLYPSHLEWMKKRTYERLPDLGGPDGNGEKVLWEIRETGYAGKGLFAVKAFEAGDTIVAERPLELYGAVSVHHSCLESYSFTRSYPRVSHRSPMKTI